MVYSSNSYLSKEEMTVNATYIMDYFTNRGWSKNAVAGMLGNMETESTINPGIWQNLNEGNLSGGFGLTQWTPATNLIDWANSNGLEPTNIDTQLFRIEHEVQTGLQWIETSAYPLSFFEFTTSDETPEYLASAFLLNYERASVEVEEERRTQARYWYNVLDGESGGLKPFFPTTIGLPVSSEYGWRIHPIDNVPDFHAAIDISGQGENHPIYATQSGVVTHNDFNDGSGWFIRIEHTGDPYFSQYLHLESQSPINVGTTVSRGQEIGTMGTTGSSTGIHLDFAISINGTFFTEEDTIDPLIYLDMTFDDGGGGSDSTIEKDIITLLLVDALNGWKY